MHVGEGGAVAGLGPALEVIDVDMPFDDLERVLAANVFHRAVVLGPVSAGPHERRRADRAASCATGEEQHAIDVAAAAMAPGRGGRARVRLPGAVGESLRAGDVIIAGSLVHRAAGGARASGSSCRWTGSGPSRSSSPRLDERGCAVMLRRGGADGAYPRGRRSLVRSHREHQAGRQRGGRAGDGRAEGPHAGSRKGGARLLRGGGGPRSAGHGHVLGAGGHREHRAAGPPAERPGRDGRLLRRRRSRRCPTCASRCWTWSRRATRRRCAGTRPGTFCGGPFQGIEPTGARVELEGIDMLTIEDGKIVRNDAYYDSGAFARAVGLLPPQESATERRMAAAFNTRTRLLRPFFTAVGRARSRRACGSCAAASRMKTMNVYLIEDDGGVTVFDAGHPRRWSAASARSRPGSAASSASCSATATPTTAALRRGSARPSSATPTTSPTPRATAASTTSASRSSTGTRDRVFPRLLGVWDGGPVQGRGHGQGGRRHRRLQGDRPPRSRARA